MTKRRNAHGTVWNAGTLVNILTIPLLTGAITTIGFYYVTNYRLDQNSQDIKSEITERQKTSKEFFDKLAALNDGIAKLNTNVAVQAEVLASIKDNLQHPHH